jgi:hypothetical protein
MSLTIFRPDHMPIACAVRIFEEDHASTWPSQGLVRGGRHHIAMFEGTWMFSSGHEATDVRNVCHQNGTHLQGDWETQCKVMQGDNM